MKVFRKSGDRVELLALSWDADLRLGDYLVVEEDGRRILLQVIDVEYADVPGLMEDILRELSGGTIDEVERFDPVEVESVVRSIRDSRVVVAKVRRINDADPNVLWLPSRYTSRVRKMDVAELLRDVVPIPKVPVRLGEGVVVDVMNVEGSVTLIVGRKESGKSHLAKVLASGLARAGCNVVVLDVNGEYVSLGRRRNGERSEVSEILKVLMPGLNYQVPLSTLSEEVLADVMTYALGLPQTSMRELLRIFRDLRKRGALTFANLLRAVQSVPMNESVREALANRLLTLESTGIFTDERREDEGDALEALFPPDRGALVVFDMSRLGALQRRVFVEFLLSRLKELLLNDEIDPVVLFAEEAHLYLRETYWEDVITRMRHVGISTVLITNQPDSIPALIYRQADNVFIFNMRNGSDMEHLARNLEIDSETLRSILPNLPQGTVLAWGKVVGRLPVVFKVIDPDLMTLGRTRTKLGRLLQQC
ncbi:MAG: ATP-binding protein [Candidatus Calditenuis sp.]|nr:ATP-binding protein [Candidatus Calditenuis sp.]